jgi:Bacteriorhodopsin-like protein
MGKLLCSGWFRVIVNDDQGISEGGNVIASDSEAIFYGILDILAKPGFGALLIWGHRNIDLSRLGLQIHDPSSSGAMPAGEKRATNMANAGTTNGTTATNGHSTDAPATTV